MSFMDEYNALKKKRKQEETGSSQNTFMQEYNELKAKRTEQDTDIRSGMLFSSSAIAPTVGKTQKNNQDKRTWFQAGAFEDGYDFGDLTRTIYATRGDIQENVGKAVVDATENLIDTGAHIVGTVGGWFSKDFREDTRKFIAKDLLQADKSGKWVAGVLSGGTSVLEAGIGGGAKNSVLGDKADGLVQSGAHLAGSMALQYLGVPMEVTMGVNAFGSEIESAYQQDATWGEGTVSAAISTAVELLTEKISGGIKFGGGTVDDFIKPLIDKISDKTVRTLAKFGVDTLGEGAEEVVSQFFSTLGQQLTYEREETWKELLKDEDKLNAYLAQVWYSLFGEQAREGYREAFTSGMALSFGSNTIQAGKAHINGVDYVSGMTADEEAVVKKVTEDRIAELEKDGKKLKISEKNAIEDQVKSDLVKGDIPTDTIEEVLGGETYKTYKDTVDSEDTKIKQLEDQLKELENAPNTVGNSKKYDSLQSQLDDLRNNSNRNQLKLQLGEEVFGRVKDSRLVESYNEKGRRSQAFEADLTQYDEKHRATVQRAIDSGILNNTRRTHEFVDMLAKLSADKGVLFDFTDNAKLKESGFALAGKTVNGYVTKDGVTLNVNSSKSLNTVVGHEITHVLEGTELYDALKQSLFEYAQSKGDYQSRYDALTELYKDVKDADIEAELAADLVGDYLFTDADFINNLSTKHRNVFQKIYDEIKYLCKIATAGSKEARKLEKVKKAFEKAYREGGKATADTKYSLSIKRSDGSVEELADARSLTTEQAASYLKQAKSGALQRNTYIPVRNDTPQVIIDTLEQVNEKIENRSLVMQVRKAQQAMADENAGNRKGQHGDNVRRHALSPEQIVDIINNLDDPSTIIYQTNRFDKTGKPLPNNVAVFVEYNNNGTESVAVIEFDSSIDPEYIGTEFGDTDYHTVVTVFEPDAERNGMAFDYAEELLSNPNNIELKIERRQPVGSATGEKHPNTSSKLPSSSVNVAQDGENVKYSLSDSDGKQLSKEQQEYFKDSKVRDENGSLKVMYHGTPNGNYTVFKAGTYFTDNKEYADRYQNASASSISTGKTASNPKTFEVYLDIKKPFDLVDAEARRIYIEDYIKGGNAVGIDPYLSDAEYDKIKTIDWTEGEDLRDFLIENGYDYDGLVLDEGADGGYGDEVKSRGTSYVVFSPEQVKDTNNLNPTSDTDIRRSLSNIGETPKQYGNYNISGKDIALEIAPVAEDIAPVKENLTTNATRNASELSTSQEKSQLSEEKSTVAPATEVTDMFQDTPMQSLEELMAEAKDIMGAMEAYEAVGDTVSVEQLMPEYEAVMEQISQLEEAERQRADSLTEADVPPEMDAPYYGDDQSAKVEDPFEDRDWDDVSKRKVKAYMYENPEVKPFFQEEALNLLGELNSTTRGARWYNDQVYYESGGGAGFGGVKRHTSASMEELLDSWGMSYADIEKGLNAIIEDHGAENIAAAKKLEFMLNDRLLNGYKDFYTNGHVPPNQDYINLLTEKQITEYSKEAFDAFMANADQYAPPVDDDIAPVQNAAPTETVNTDSMKGVNKGQLTYITTEDKLKNRYPQPGAADVNIAPSSEVKTEQKNVQEGQQAMWEGAEGEPKRQTRKELHGSIIDNIKSRFSEKGFDLDSVLKGAKNLSTFATVDNTPQRVMEKALGYKEGQILSDITVNQVAQNETEGTKWLNSFTDRKSGLLAQLSKQYNIKPGSKQSAAAQMYAEGFYVNENNEIIKYGDAELAKDFPDFNVQANIKGLARDPRIRQIYDYTLAMINESRTRNAYPEIPRLDNYFLHFRAMDDTFSRLGLPFNPNDIRAKDLPTDLNGVTADLKPGQPYFASAMHRKGMRTSFDLLGGLERYLTSAKNQIYHIDDIQTLRALRNYIADTYGQANGLEGLDALSEEEAQERIEKVYSSHLSTFAKFLNEEANVLAGKTALIDRGLEGILGRRGMTFLDTVNKQVGSNMVGFNISSSLTNFLPVAQTFAKTNKADFVKAFGQTVGNKIGSVFGNTDGFTENSPVVIRRKGADRFYRTPFQKVGDAGYVFMSAVDDISTELIARTKYNELIRKGMDSQQAHYETDKWVSRLMGDRSLGQMPQLYNSKMLGLITKFQLEVRNQLDSQFYDTIQESKVSNEHIQNGLARNAKTAAKVTSTFVQLAVAQHLFGKVFESVAGYNPAFDIIEVLMTAFGFDDEEESEDTVLDNVEQGFLAMLEDLPYTSTFTGGRIPISSALPIKELVTGKDDYGTDKPRLETLGEVAPYYVLPGGYGQIKKTVQGLKMFSDEHPVAGSYTDKGDLRFPVDDTLVNRVQAGLFGQYASKNARKYFDNNLAPLNEKQVQEYATLGLSYDEYWAYRDDMSAISKRADVEGASDEDVVKSKYINSIGSELSDIQKEKERILNDANMTAEEKEEKVGELEKQFADLVKERYNSYNHVSLDGDYAKIGSYYYQWYTPEDGDPYWRKLTDSQVTKYTLTKNAGNAHYVTNGSVHYRRDQDGEWTKISDKQLERQKEVTQALGITPEEYWSKTDISFMPMPEGEYEYAFDHPDNYAVAKAVGGYDAYTGYSKDLYNIKADKDKNGKSISGSRKEKVIDYINGLDADYGEKIILFKSEYPSDDTYNYEIIDYLNSRDDISYSEMETILKELGFNVSSDGHITWD